MANYYDWIKRLGQWHISKDNDPRTLCGTPMLGNNYPNIPKNERTRCELCFRCYEQIEAQDYEWLWDFEFDEFDNTLSLIDTNTGETSCQIDCGSGYMQHGQYAHNMKLELIDKFRKGEQHNDTK